MPPPPSSPPPPVQVLIVRWTTAPGEMTPAGGLCASTLHCWSKAPPHHSTRVMTLGYGSAAWVRQEPSFWLWITRQNDEAWASAATATANRATPANSTVTNTGTTRFLTNTDPHLRD